MKGHCLCGAIEVVVPGPPDYMNLCNCTLCTKLGALWGYYRGGEVTFAGEPVAYVRTDVASPSISAHFCGRCGATTHWASLSGEPRFGVNMRLFDPGALAGIDVLYGDGLHRAEGQPRTYYRTPTLFDSTEAQP